MEYNGNVAQGIDNCEECVEYLFQNSEKLPDGFYIKIMELLKELHVSGNNLAEIHRFVDENKNVINQEIFLKIKEYLNKESTVIVVIEGNTLPATCCEYIIHIKSIIFIVSFVSVGCVLLARYSG